MLASSASLGGENCNTVASIHHDDSPSSFPESCIHWERKIPRYFEAIRHKSELALTPGDLRCDHSSFLELGLTAPGNKVLAKAWLIGRPLGGL